MAMGMTAGAIGSFVGNPSELILIRMTADGRLPVAERRNYTGFFNALFRIAREEGKRHEWRLSLGHMNGHANGSPVPHAKVSCRYGAVAYRRWAARWW